MVSAYTAAGGFREVSPDELHELIQEQGDGQAHRVLLLLDVRPRSEYEARESHGRGL